jgi:hypothetical protein
MFDGYVAVMFHGILRDHVTGIFAPCVSEGNHEGRMLFGLMKKHASRNVPWISEETKHAGMFCGFVRVQAGMFRW